MVKKITPKHLSTVLMQFFHKIVANFQCDICLKNIQETNHFLEALHLHKAYQHFFKNSENLNIVKDQVISLKKLDNNLWNVVTKKTTYTATNICIATPWNIAESLLKDILPNITSHTNRPSMSDLLSVAIVFNKQSIDTLGDISGLIGKEQFFYSAISRDIIKHDTLRSLVFHCKDIQSNEQEALDKISNLLDIDKKDIIYSTSKHNTLPCYNINHKKFISDLDLELSNHNNLYVSGNFIDRLAIENCIKRSVKEANRLISNKLQHKKAT